MPKSPADVDNNTDSFVGLMDFCHQSYRCAPLWIATYAGVMVGTQLQHYVQI